MAPMWKFICREPSAHVLRTMRRDTATQLLHFTPRALSAFIGRLCQWCTKRRRKLSDSPFRTRSASRSIPPVIGLARRKRSETSAAVLLPVLVQLILCFHKQLMSVTRGINELSKVGRTERFAQSLNAVPAHLECAVSRIGQLPPLDTLADGSGNRFNSRAAGHAVLWPVSVEILNMFLFSRPAGLVRTSPV